MGTNYYAVTERNKCECCKRSDLTEIHIGKKSCGWAFTFQGYHKGALDTQWEDETVSVGLESWADYKAWLADKIIKDEYGDIVPFSEFVNIVELWGSPSWINPHNNHKNLSHNVEVRNNSMHSDLHYLYSDPTQHWEDELGYSFGIEKFS